MNIAQFTWHDCPFIGDIFPNGRIRLFNQPCSLLDVVKIALKKGQPLSEYIAERLSHVYLDRVDIASPSFVFKTHAAQMITSGEALSTVSHGLGASEAARLAGIYYVDEDKHLHRLGFCLGHVFCDYAPVQETHFCINQCGPLPFALGAEIMMDELPTSIQLTSCIYRDEKLMCCDEFGIKQSALSHADIDMESHLLDNPSWATADTLYYHLVDIPHAYDRRHMSLEDNDIVKIDADCFRFPLVNQIHQRKLDNTFHTNTMR